MDLSEQFRQKLPNGEMQNSKTLGAEPSDDTHDDGTEIVYHNTGSDPPYGNFVDQNAEFAISPEVFLEIAREIAESQGITMPFQRSAMGSLHEASEMYLMCRFAEAQRKAQNDRSDTVRLSNLKYRNLNLSGVPNTHESGMRWKTSAKMAERSSGLISLMKMQDDQPDEETSNTDQPDLGKLSIALPGELKDVDAMNTA